MIVIFLNPRSHLSPSRHVCTCGLRTTVRSCCVLSFARGDCVEKGVTDRPASEINTEREGEREAEGEGEEKR